MTARVQDLTKIGIPERQAKHLGHNGGWTQVNESWTYASATTVTVPAGAASRFGAGMRVRFSQSGAIKYFDVAGVADTEMTVSATWGDTVENASISDIWLSTDAAPLGFPRPTCATPGDIKISARATPEAGWLSCNGSAISRTTYAALFAAIGTAYGAGDGSTTFNVPNLQQRFPLGKAASGTGSTLGAAGGSIDHAHAETQHTHETKAHYHGMGTGADLNITASGSHSHLTADGRKYVTAYAGGGATFARTGGGAYWFEELDTERTHTHPAANIAGRIGLVTEGVNGNANQNTTQNAASNTGGANPPYQVVNYFIKT